MNSSIFYKFKNSKELSRVVFNGTSISVFEAKKQIIVDNGLGSATDYDLKIFPQDEPDVEYKDDTTLIPRTTTIIAVRRPAPRGTGRGHRYLTGKAPTRALPTTKTPAPAPTSGAPIDDPEAAFFAESAVAWDAQKEALSNAKPVYRQNTKQVVIPSHPPPPGYVCRRCNIKGHWIQACPTNDDPDFKPVFQAKRTTGIPQSFLKKVEKPVDEEAAKGIMLNADGEYVQVMTDTKTWDKFQEKNNAIRAREASAEAASKELRDRGLLCPIDNQRFINPVTTPCCKQTYCRECIDDALANGDLTCPHCGEANVLIDNVQPDAEKVKALKEYDAEKAAEREKEKATTEAVASSNEQVSNTENASDKVIDTTTATTSANADVASDTDSTASSKKRKQPPTTIAPPTAPKAMRTQQNAADPTQDFIAQMEMLKNTPMGFPMPMQPMQMAYPNNAFQQPGGPQQWYGAPGQFGYGQQQGGYGGGYGQQQNFGGPQQNFGGQGQNFGGQQGYGGGYGQQQQYGWGGQQGGQGAWMQPGGPHAGGQQQEDANDAYERQPVNPRGRNNRRSRAPDYRYL